MGPGKERFGVANLRQPACDFVESELAKPKASRFEAICFDARMAPIAEIVQWIRALDIVQDEEDVNPKNDHGYYIRRVVILKSRRAWTAGVPEPMRSRPDITCIVTTDPSDAPTLYRRHLTDQFQGVLGLFGAPAKGSPKPRR